MGLGAAGGTYALLSANMNVEGSGVTITAGSFDLSIGGGSPAANISPSTPSARAFTVTSVGDVPSTLSARITATTSTAITGNTEVRITPVADAAACVVGRQGISQPFLNLSGYTSPPLGALAAGETRTFCLEVRLKAETPVSQSGQGVAFTLTVTGTQRAG